MSERKGSCLCGAVNITAKSDRNALGVCHCSKCRKWGGGSFMEIECGSDIKIEGSENIIQYQSSQQSIRAFCKVCGTHLYMKPASKEEYGIPPGLFEDDEGIHFDRKVFFDRKPEYYSFSNPTRKISSETIYERYP